MERDEHIAAVANLIVELEALAQLLQDAGCDTTEVEQSLDELRMIIIRSGS